MNGMKTLFNGFNFRRLSHYPNRLSGDGNGNSRKHDIL